MPKIKTNKTAIKRVKITGSGKLKRRNIGTSHLNRKNDANKKHRKARYKELSAAFEKKFKKMMPHHNF